MSEDGGIKKLFHDLHDTVPAASKLIAEMRETIHRLECACGENGRRVGFKFRCPLGRVSSILKKSKPLRPLAQDKE